jgi:hypothetical protein
MIENGFVHLPKEAAWLAEYRHALTVLPNGKHDDRSPRTLRSGGDRAHARLVQAGGPRAGRIYQLYKAQQAAASQTPKLPPLSTLLLRW